MKKIYANNLTTLSLGRQGENLARQVVFDIRDLESLYGYGTVEVIYNRPGDAQPYPLAVQRDGTIVTWDVTATDTEMSDGYGKCELRYYAGETLAKSQIWRTWVEPAMDTPSETAPPEPEQGWVDQVLAAGAAAMTAADGAKADADRAAALAAEVAEKAAQAAKDASDAAKAMEAAQTAQRLAEEAQGAAETARTAAETAQVAAEQSATDAEGAKQAAESALKSTQDAAATAAQALSDILALYQEMQTWAQGVVQDVNEAGSHAVQSVQSAGDAQVQRVTDEGTTQTANAKAQADAAALSAAGAAQSAQQAAESAAVYESVASDVNQLKADVEHLAPTIVCEASGDVITLDDSCDRPFSGLKLYGKTTQDGTPSPDAPVELVSVGAGGSVAITVSDGTSNQTMTVSTPNGLPGIPVDSGGNYTDASGQQWVCDEVDFARGVYVQRVCRYAFTGNETLSNYDSGKLVGRAFVDTGLPECKVSVSGSSLNMSPIMSNVAVAKTQNDLLQNGGTGIAVSKWAQISYFYFDSATYGNVDQVKGKMATAYSNGTPWEMCYALETPTETPLSDEELSAYAALRTNYQNTIITNDSGAWMEIEYQADTKLYIDKQFAELRNAIVALGGNV